MTKQQTENLKSRITMIAAFAALIGATAKFTWSTFAIPQVDGMICEKVNPLIDALEFQNYLMMEAMPDSVVERASRKYINSRKGSAR